MNVHEAIRVRRSVREYSPEPIPDETLSKLRDALRLAPSACNNQPWKFIFVWDQSVRRQLARLARDQHFIAQAPLVVVGCGYPERAYPRMGGHGNSVDIDVAIALDHLTLAAASEGLGTCWIGAFDEQAVKRLLGVPERAKIVAMTPVGYPARPGLLRPVADAERKPPGEVFCENRYAE